ncbi:MAG: DMT family transporter [Chloroflexota bacterium]
MTNHAAPYIITLGLSWGLNLVVSRAGIAEIATVEYTFWRFAIATVIFAIMIALSPGRKWSRNPALWRDAAVVGVFGSALPLLGLMGSLSFQSAGLTSLLVSTGPAFIVTTAHFMLPDAKLTRQSVAGVLIALCGAGMIVILGESGLPDLTRANPIGYLMVIGALMMDAMVAVYVRRRMQGYDPFEVTGIRLAVAMVFLLPLAVAVQATDDRTVTAVGWGALLFSAVVSTVIAQLLFFYVTQVFGTTSLAITIYLVPVVAILTGVFFLGEAITPGMIASMLLIIFGVYLINRSRIAAEKAAR